MLYTPRKFANPLRRERLRNLAIERRPRPLDEAEVPLTETDRPEPAEAESSNNSEPAGPSN